MDKKTLHRTVLFLFLLSAVIYGLQLLIFRDPATTFFYVFQDFAFLPASIAIATLIVGELLSAQEKRERAEKTRMLTSNFFTELGYMLTRELLEIAEPKEQLTNILALRCSSEADLKTRQDYIRSISVNIRLNRDSWQTMQAQILESRPVLMNLAANPMLLDHEDFTELLWAIFHIIDEYRLRGDYDSFSKADFQHLNKDFETLLTLLLVNYIANARYLEETYPNLYRTAANRIRASIEDIE